MRLFFAHGSPFARIVRVALLETGLDLLVLKEEATLRHPASALLALNPAGRVPTLELDDGTILTESLLILDFIDTKHAGRSLLKRDNNAHRAEMGAASGLLEGIVTWARALRPPENERSPAVIAYEAARVNRTADALERSASKGAYAGPHITAARIILGCALGWVEPRHPVWKWREGRPALSAWHDQIAAMPSFQATLPTPL